MKKKTELVMAVMLLLAAVFAAPKSAEYVMSVRTEAAAPCVVIDAGHGRSQLRKIKERQPLSLKNCCQSNL